MSVVFRSDDKSNRLSRFTVSVGEDDHQFEAWVEAQPDGSVKAVVAYIETQSWRGTKRVSEPSDDVYQQLISSDNFISFIEDYDIDEVEREMRSQ